MKLQDVEGVKEIKDWVAKGPNHCPNDIQVSTFIRGLIPYLEDLERRLELIEAHLKINQPAPGISGNI